jgi:hypothetical protein
MSDLRVGHIKPNQFSTLEQMATKENISGILESG